MSNRLHNSLHFERLLLVVGPQNAGKSRLLRTMFLDPRLGTRGIVPSDKKIKLVTLSYERCLAVRCTSPHEMKETLEKFLQKLDVAMRRAYRDYWRFNYACAMQPHPANRMPDLVTVCKRLEAVYQPERIRIVQIDPQQNGNKGTLLVQDQIDELREHKAEIMTVDAHRSSAEHPNGLMLADFFDFT